MIREATHDDIPALLDMGMRFHAGSVYAGLLVPDREVTAGTLRMLIQSETGVVFVMDYMGTLTGAVLGALCPHWVTGETIAVELSWWVDEAHRGSGLTLLSRFEDWARERGASKVTVVEPAGNPGVAMVYQRRGYQLVEKSWMKAI